MRYFMKKDSYQMKPQDIVVALEILLHQKNGWTQKGLAASLGISQSEISQSINRLKYSFKQCFN